MVFCRQLVSIDAFDMQANLWAIQFVAFETVIASPTDIHARLADSEYSAIFQSLHEHYLHANTIANGPALNVLA